MNISRRTFYNWEREDNDFKEAREEARQGLKDFGESQLVVLMTGIPIRNENGELIGWEEKPCKASTIFFNKTINKDRGYIEKYEIGGLPGKPEDRLDLSNLTTQERIEWLELMEKMKVKDN